MNWIQRQFLALYELDLPSTVVLNSRTYRRVQTFKYDFFAGTGLYELAESSVANDSDAPRQIVAKIYRYRRFFGLPMGWIGKISVRHEGRLYRMLHDIPGIPRFIGLIGKTGFGHEFIAGRQLDRQDRPNDEFFDRLKGILEAIHARNASYVDLHKLGNIILGEDGKPYLIDFQISYAPRLRWPIVRQITGLVLRQFQQEDFYHYIKHKRRLRRDLVSQEDIAKSYQPSLPNRIHRFASKPYFWIRHWVMNVLGLESTVE
jgi:hypothetical protein